jgi:hypothetical protein
MSPTVDALCRDGACVTAQRADAPGWRPIEWSVAEHENFAFLRSHSNETDVLVAAIEHALRAAGVRAAGARGLDLGSGGSRLSDELRGLFGSYVPLPIDGREAAARLLRDLQLAGGGVPLGFDVCVFSHVIPYIVDLERTLALLAARATPDGHGVAILCDDRGDQHEIGRLAAAWEPTYGRTHDHARQFARLMTARGIAFRSFSVMSQATVRTRDAARRVVAFFTGSADASLLSRLAEHLRPDADGAFRLSSGHRVFVWRMRAFASPPTAPVYFGSVRGTGACVETGIEA